MNVKIKKSLLILTTLAFTTTCFANNFRFTPRAKIEAQIASGELNRVEVNGGDIMEVIGDASKYSLYWSSDWRNLFIKPKVAVGETVDLSLIFFGGLAQDVRFTVGDTTAKTITVDVDNSHYRHIHHHDFRQLSDQRLHSEYHVSEVAAMMRAMFSKIKGKYYVTDVKRNLQTSPNLQISQIKAYRYEDLTGAVLEVKNVSKAAVKLSEEDFANVFNTTLAINLKSPIIAPKSKSLVFIVTKEVDYAK